MLSEVELLDTWCAVREEMHRGASFTAACTEVAAEEEFDPTAIRYRVRRAAERLGLSELKGLVHRVNIDGEAAHRLSRKGRTLWIA